MDWRKLLERLLPELVGKQACVGFCLGFCGPGLKELPSRRLIPLGWAKILPNGAYLSKEASSFESVFLRIPLVGRSGGPERTFLAVVLNLLDSGVGSGREQPSLAPFAVLSLLHLVCS